ncbi:Chitin synthase, class 5 [Rhizina undulata]
MLISLTVGKVDAGLAILLTEDKRLIEFPSILLPSGISSGSIVDIQVSRNTSAEASSRAAFQSLQDEIYNLYGIHSPSKPVLRVRNATQTSVVLEWDPIDLATATLRSLTLYRNNSKAGAIPNPTTHTSTKISGLAVDTEYSFHLVLRTSAGTYSSEKISVKTHKMTDLTGVTVCPGFMPGETREALSETLHRIGAKPLQDFVRIDTTHFVCTEPRGQLWERATEMNIPVVRPEWVEACEREGRIVGVRQFYLNVELPKIRSAPNRNPHIPQHRVSQSVADLNPTRKEKKERRESVMSAPNMEAGRERREREEGLRSPTIQEREESIKSPTIKEKEEGLRSPTVKEKEEEEDVKEKEEVSSPAAENEGEKEGIKENNSDNTEEPKAPEAETTPETSPEKEEEEVVSPGGFVSVAL